MRTRQLLKNQQGFTLIEIIAVLILLGILAAVAVPKYMDMQVEAQDKAVQGALAAGASNVTMSYSKFLLVNSRTPNRIVGNNWRYGGLTQAIATNLGDFTATYTYVNSTGVVTITILTGPAWFAGSGATKVKLITIQ